MRLREKNSPSLIKKTAFKRLGLPLTKMNGKEQRSRVKKSVADKPGVRMARATKNEWLTKK